MRTITGIALSLLLLASGARAGDLGGDVERGLGKMVAEDLESTYGVVDDPLLNGWVNRLGQKLASVSGRSNLKYQFKVLDSDEINAVAAPGGFVYVNRGTLAFVKSEDELAAVLGHEVGHVAGRHAMKQLGAQVLGTLALIGFRAAHMETLSTVGGIAGGLAMLKFTRDEENDADRRGLRNAVNSGYDGKAMIRFFEHLDATEKERPSKLEVYFLTHPPTPERIKRIEKEPGTAVSSANELALADGYTSRSLFREAVEAYRKAIELSGDSADLKVKLSEVAAREPQTVAAKPLTDEARSQRLKELEEFTMELAQVKQQMEDDRQKVASAQKETSSELQSAAQSLSDASQLITQRQTIQYLEFVHMARAFDRAVRIGGNLRSAKDMTEDTLAELDSLAQQMRQDLNKGDASAAFEVDSLAMVGHSVLQDLSTGIKQVRARAGSGRDGARELRQAADSLVTSYRTPFGYTSGQFNILDLQVNNATDTLSEGVEGTHKALGSIAHARMMELVSRINYITRLVRPDDAATAGIISHYLGVPASDVTRMRGRLEFGDAALALADEELDKAHDAKKRKGARTVSYESHADDSVQKGLKWENASVLFNLMAHDLEREVGE